MLILFFLSCDVVLREQRHNRAQPSATPLPLRAGRSYASQKTIAEKFRTALWQRRQPECGQRHAPQEERHAPFRQERQGWTGEEPQAGHRYRSVGSAQKGRQGPTQESRIGGEPGRAQRPRKRSSASASPWVNSMYRRARALSPCSTARCAFCRLSFMLSWREEISPRKP